MRSCYNISGGNMERIIMHIDVNNAFLSWTAVLMLNEGANIDIRNTYAVIGFEESRRHGIVLAKSTPIKKKGVKPVNQFIWREKNAQRLKYINQIINGIKKCPINYLI